MINKGDLFSTAAGGKFRLLAVNGRPGKEVAHVFGMDERKSLPKQWALADLKAGLKSAEYKRIASKGLPVVVKVKHDAASGDDPDPAQWLATWRWDLIKALVSNELIYLRRHRGKLVANRATETGTSEQTIMTCLRLYWRGGMTRDALLGAYHRCGTTVKPTTTPQRPRGAKPRNGRYEKYTMLPAEKEKVFATATRHFKKKRTNTKQYIYRRVVAVHYSVVGADGVKKPLPLGQRPTRGQVTYLLDKNNTLEKVLRRKLGDDNFEKDIEPKTGSARDYANGVGQYYEIDATILDLWICAEDDPATIIGKATLYLIVDVFSRLIVGFHLTLDKPSWMGAMEAMMSLVTDKRKLCERWGFEYRKEDWLAHGVWPAFFRGDRGTDVIGYDSDTVADGLETGFINTPRRRAQRKGTIECTFKLMHVPIKDHVGGYTPPSEMGQRQTDDHKGEATRNLKSAGQEILAAMRLSNHKVHKGIKLPATDVYKKRQPTPSLLWKHDSEERAGMLTSFEEDYLRFKLLPNDTFTVTAVGVFYKGLLWEPEKALRKQWLLPATQGTYKVTATFHRDLVDFIYVHDPKDPTKWTTMHLSDRCLDHAGKSFAEFEAVEDARLTLEELADELNLALEIEHDEGAIARETAARKAAEIALRKAAGRSRTNGGVEKRQTEIRRARVKTTVLATTAVAPSVVPSGGLKRPARPQPTPQPPSSASSAAPAPEAATNANAALQSLLNLKKKKP